MQWPLENICGLHLFDAIMLSGHLEYLFLKLFIMEIVVKQINSKNAEKLKYTLNLEDKVSKLRRLVANDLQTEESSIKLIFKGRFLKDETDLGMHGACKQNMAF